MTALMLSETLEIDHLRCVLCLPSAFQVKATDANSSTGEARSPSSMPYFNGLLTNPCSRYRVRLRIFFVNGITGMLLPG